MVAPLAILSAALFVSTYHHHHVSACELRHNMDAGYHQEFAEVLAATDSECCEICANNTRCGYASWDKPKGKGKCDILIGFMHIHAYSCVFMRIHAYSSICVFSISNPM